MLTRRGPEEDVMRAVLVILVLAAIAAGAWLTRERWMPDVAEAPAAPEADAAAPPRDAPPAGAADTPRPAAEQVQREAERYVATLTEPEPEPVQVERADHFVTGDQMLSLVPRRAVEEISLEAMQADPSLAGDTPITVVREVEQVERITPEKLIARSAGDLDTRVTVLVEDVPRESTVRQVLQRAQLEPDRPIDIVTRNEYYEQTTVDELAAREDEPRGRPLKVIRRVRGLEAASIEQLMREASLSPDSLFYVRAVRPDDSQGIWGIVHDGIIDNFARGMAIRRGREINTYRVDIPRDADERRDDRSSSFLGKLIHEKTRASFVYNFERGRMGRNPDRIFPGQEIVIIDFQPDELIRIYKHFVEQRG